MELWRALLDPAAHARLLDLDVSTVAWHHAHERKGAVGCGVFYEPYDEAGWRKVFGALGAHETYFTDLCLGGSAPLGPRDAYGDAPGAPIAPIVLRNLRYVHTFITDATNDALIRGDGLLLAFKEAPGVASATLVDESDAERELVVTLESRETHHIRFPLYPMTGHAVSLFQPEQLLRDVERWHRATRGER